MASQNLMVCCDCHLYPLDACVLCVCVYVLKNALSLNCFGRSKIKLQRNRYVCMCVCVICAWDCDTASPPFHRIWTLPEASVLEVLLQLASRCVSRCLVCIFLQILSRIVRLHLDSVFSPWQKERCHMSVPL